MLKGTRAGDDAPQRAETMMYPRVSLDLNVSFWQTASAHSSCVRDRCGSLTAPHQFTPGGCGCGSGTRSQSLLRSQMITAPSVRKGSCVETCATAADGGLPATKCTTPVFPFGQEKTGLSFAGSGGWTLRSRALCDVESHALRIRCTRRRGAPFSNVTVILKPDKGGINRESDTKNVTSAGRPAILTGPDLFYPWEHPFRRPHERLIGARVALVV